MLKLIPSDFPIATPGQDGHGGKAAMASSRHRKRGR
jgi:hypothetical protein